MAIIREQQVDWVLDATGRIPNDDQIGLEAAGVTFNQRGIPVDDHLQTNVPEHFRVWGCARQATTQVDPNGHFESYYLYQRYSAGQTTDSLTIQRYHRLCTNSELQSRCGRQKKLLMAITVVHNHIPDDWYHQADPGNDGDSILIFDRDHHLVGTQLDSVPKRKMRSTPNYQQLSSTPSKQQMWQMAHIFPSEQRAAAWHKIR